MLWTRTENREAIPTLVQSLTSDRYTQQETKYALDKDCTQRSFGLNFTSDRYILNRRQNMLWTRIVHREAIPTLVWSEFNL